MGRQAALNDNTIEARIIGGVVAAQNDPAQWFKALWLNLYDNRERCRIMAWRKRNGGNDLPGHIAIAWGLGGANHVQNPQSAAALWSKLAAAIVETRLTEMAFEDTNTLLNSSTCLACVLGARLVMQGSLPAGDFAQIVTTSVGPTPEFGRLVAVVMTNGGLQPLLEAGRAAGKQRVIDALDRAIEYDAEVRAHRFGANDLEAIRQFQAAL